MNRPTRLSKQQEDELQNILNDIASKEAAQRTPEDELEDLPEDTRTNDEILQSCRKAIWVRLDRITKALIAQTLKKGSYLHARFLFDLVGVSREQQREPREDGSLVELLLEKLEAPTTTAHSETEPGFTQCEQRSPHDEKFSHRQELSGEDTHAEISVP